MSRQGYASASLAEDVDAEEEHTKASVGAFRGPQAIQLVDKRDSVAFVPGSPQSQYAVLGEEGDEDVDEPEVYGGPDHQNQLPADGFRFGDTPPPAEAHEYTEAATPRGIPRSESSMYFQEAAKHLPAGLVDVIEHPDEVLGDDYSDIYRPVPIPNHMALAEQHDFASPRLAANPAEQANGPLPYPEDNEFQTGGATVEDNDGEFPGGAYEDAHVDIDMHQQDFMHEQNFEMVTPSHAQYQGLERPATQEMDPNAVFYPAPIPQQLRLPPLLSRRRQEPKVSGTGFRKRPKSVLLSGKPPPVWSVSPLDEEVTATRDDSADELEDEVDDANSDRATLPSEDEDYQELTIDRENEGTGLKLSADGRRKSNGWLSAAWGTLIGKQGETVPEGEEDVDVEEADFMAKSHDFGFTRFDPEIVEQQTRMLRSGGVYSGVRPANGKVTSLVEELEIRKSGRIAQHAVVHREADEIRAAVGAQNRFAHPLDQAHQPTLLELQEIAKQDYQERKEWHTKALNQSKLDKHSGETLAQRRARIRAQKAATMSTGEATPASLARPEPVGETLAQRRARLKLEKQLVRQAQGQYYADSEHMAQSPSAYVQAAAAQPAQTPIMEQNSKQFESPASANSMLRTVAMHM